MADSDLLELQSHCRRDGYSYRVEFLTQYNQYRALVSSAELRPSLENKNLEYLSSFMAHVSSVYLEEGKKAAEDHVRMLRDSGPALHAALRRALVKSLAIMHRKGAVAIDVMVPVLFQLLVCKDKLLRKNLSEIIISSIKFVNKKHRNEKMNRVLQKYMYTTFKDSDGVLVKRSLNISIDLFRRQIWNDVQTANVLASAVFHPAPEVMIIATRFLLESDQRPGSDDENESDDDNVESSGDENMDGKSAQAKAKDLWKLYNLTGKKNARKTARVQKAMSKLTRKKKKKTSTAQGTNPFSAIMLINDPQEFAERLFSDLKTRRKNVRFEAKLALMNLITRLIGTHELLLLNLYPFLQRYLQPHQEKVTLVLAYLAQACHSLVPPDVLYPVIRTLADNFITERCSGEVMAVGLNSVRAICTRVPLAIEVEETGGLTDNESKAALLQDLVMYKNHRDKGVNIAARSLLQLYREVNPSLLLKKDRGKDAMTDDVERKPVQYGARNVAETVAGLELLEVSNSDDDDVGIGAEDEAEADDIEDDDKGAEVVGEDDEEDAEVESEDDREEAEISKCGEEEAKAEVDSRAQREDSDCAQSNEEEKAKDDSDSGNDSDDESDDGEEEDLPPALLPPSSDVATSRLLTDDDFKRMREKSAEKELAGIIGAKRSINEGYVDPKVIESYQKKQKRTLEERLETVREGREGRMKFGSSKGRRDKKGGTTNMQKAKMKQNAMVIHKVRRKGRTKGRSKGGKQPGKTRR